MKSFIMKDAWLRAKRASRLRGGNAKEWMAWALVRAWKAFKNGELTKKEEKEVKPVLRGMMTAKQEAFIDSLLWKKAGRYDITDTLIKAFRCGVRDRISKKQASSLIDYLLSC